MSKVVHLSDEAHVKAKIFCKQHGLKMSDWVAALIEDAINTGRTDPTIKVRPALAPAPAPSPAPTAITTAATPRPTSNGPQKKKLERFEEPVTTRAPVAPPVSDNGGVPPWAAPPFWAQHKAQSSK